MNLPNGFGSVYKLSGKRRNPYVARKTTGWTFDEEKQKSYPIYKFIGYYPTKQDALTALVEYNKEPYDLETNKITFGELYEKWSEVHYSKVSESNVKGCKASFNVCSDLVDMPIRDIKLDHLQKVIDESGKNTPTLRKVKIMWGLMWDYAIIHEMLPADRRQMVRYVDISQAGNPNKVDRKPFSKGEIQKLWDNVSRGENFQIPIILIYTGLRIGEFYNLKKEDVHLDEKWFFVREAKTESGIREVPIADKVFPFFEYWFNRQGSEYMFPNTKGKKHLDQSFRKCWWIPLMDELGMGGHLPHDTRHTCVSLLTTAGVDERIIKKIVGHKGQGVTETVYTHLDMDAKLEAINRI